MTLFLKLKINLTRVHCMTNSTVPNKVNNSILMIYPLHFIIKIKSMNNSLTIYNIPYTTTIQIEPKTEISNKDTYNYTNDNNPLLCFR